MGITHKSNIKWHYVRDNTEAARIVGQKISADLTNWNNEPVLLLLSGGSSLRILDYIEIQNWTNITLFFLDERFSVNNTDSNFAELTRTNWFTEISQANANFIDSRVLPGENQNSFSKRLTENLNSWLKKNPTGKKIAIMGMGPDGHIGGIFPYPENPDLFAELFTGRELIVLHDVTGKNKFPHRVTTTYSFFHLIDKSYAYICGEEKRKALSELQKNKLPHYQLPAKILYNLKDVFLVTDINI